MKRISRAKKGQTLVEYALVVAFIAVVAIGVLASLGGQIKSTFSTLNSQMTPPVALPPPRGG